jgi:hypothetical protein
MAKAKTVSAVKDIVTSVYKKKKREKRNQNKLGTKYDTETKDWEGAKHRLFCRSRMEVATMKDHRESTFDFVSLTSSTIPMQASSICPTRSCPFHKHRS